MLVLRKSVQSISSDSLIAVKIFAAVLQMRKRRLIQLQKFDRKRIFAQEQAQKEEKCDVTCVTLLVNS